MADQQLVSRVLFPTDFSETSNRAQRYAIDLARQFHASVHLLHVIESLGSPEEAPDLSEFYKMLTHRATSRLEKAAADFQAVGVEATWEVALGSRWQIIVRRATELASDLIVMGAHGLRADRQFVPGSTSQRVPLVAPCPVLLVRLT